MDDVGSLGPSVNATKLEGSNDLIEMKAREGRETTHLYLLQEWPMWLQEEAWHWQGDRRLKLLEVWSGDSQFQKERA